MKLWRPLITLALVLASNGASGAIYHWLNVAPSSTISSAEGILEISDAAFSTGRVESSWGPGGGGRPPPEDPFISFYLKVLSIGPLGGFGMSHVVAGDTAGGFESSWSILLNPPHQGHLTGFIRVDSPAGDSSISMGGGANGLWTIDFLAGPSSVCAHGRFCSGATGRWVLVPEPPALLLLCIGLLAVVSIRRRTPR